MDESCHQSQAQEEFRQSAYSSEPNTRVQSPLPCLLNSLFCHFQSQFVTVTWLSSPVSCHRGVKKRSWATTENMSVSVKCLCCNGKVLMGRLLSDRQTRKKIKNSFGVQKGCHENTGSGSCVNDQEWEAMMSKYDTINVHYCKLLSIFFCLA